MGIISKKQIIMVSLLPGGILLTWLLGYIPEMVEKLYSNGFYRILGPVLSRLTGLVPLSIAELLTLIALLALACFMIKYLVNMVRRTSSPKIVLARAAVLMLVVGSIVYFTFLLIWGFNYYRLPFADIAGLDTADIRAEELEVLCTELIQQANELRAAAAEDNNGVISIAKQEILEQAWQGYALAESMYPELGGTYGRPKAVISSRAMSVFGISGIYFPFTGEANLNMEVPAPLFPAAVCHEMAHQRGFAREDEANYIAYLSCQKHTDPFFQYSGTLLALINSMNALSAYDYTQYLELRQGYAKGVERDLSAVQQFWQQHQGPVSRASARVNDVYLKTNHQQDGINSYGRMVDLLVAERREL